MRWLALALMVGLLLSGCSSKGSGDGDASQAGDQPNDGSGPTEVSDGTTSQHQGNNGGTTSGNSGTNHAPVGSMLVSTTKGNAPLRVNFTLDGRDQDGDKLTWTLDANGDGKADSQGSALPKVASFNYTTPGLYKVTFKVTDGKQDVSFPATVNVTANVPQGAQAPITITGTITGAYIGTPVGIGLGYTNIDDHPFDVTMEAKQMTVHLDWDQTTPDLDMYLLAPDGTSAGTANAYNEPTGTAFDAKEPDIIVTDPTLLAQLGSWDIQVAPGEAANSAYTVTITFA
ncbi:MAG: PKD domain-containing protein [bacterium]